MMPINSEELLPEFLFYQLQTMYQEIRAITGDNQRSGLNVPILKELVIVVPPLSVQEEIVAEIDGYKKIINGARQVVENYKPTIKVDPMWSMVKLEEVFRLASGRFLSGKDRGAGIYNVYGGNGITGKHDKYFVEKETLVIGRVGEYCGVVHITSPKCWVTDNALMVTQYLVDIEPKYLCVILNQIDLHQYAKVGGQPSISQSTLYDIKIPLPNFLIQKNIVKDIDEEITIIVQNQRLIEIFKRKIEDVINKIWAFDKSDNNIVSILNSENTLRFAARNSSEKFIEAVRNDKDGDSDE